MGRGTKWDAAECEVAIKAWISATANNVNGADQKESQFAKTIRWYVIQFAPANPHSQKYGGQGENSIFKFLKSDIMKEVNLFSHSLNKVDASKPTCHRSETDIHCMAIALHLGMTYTVNPMYPGNNYLAFLVLQNHPMFFTCPNASVNRKPAPVPPYTNDIPSSNSQKLASQSAIPSYFSDITVSDESESGTRTPNKHNNNAEGKSISKRQFETNTPVEKQLSSSEMVPLLEFRSKRGKLCKKKAKLQLMEKCDQKARDGHFKVVSKSMTSIAETHAGLLTVCKQNESHWRLKLLLSKLCDYFQ
jgi:DNA relaxase NicK